MRDQTRSIITEMQTATTLLRPAEIGAAASLLVRASREGRDVYTFGNGGSASTASHLVVDLSRIDGGSGGAGWRVTSLTDNVAWMTAVSNDRAYAECFAEPLRARLRPGDLVIGISASGDSENVVRGFKVARDIGANRLALIGFNGGRLARLATHRIWVDSHDYGIVESLHLFVGHALVRIVHDRLKSEASDRPTRERIGGSVRSNEDSTNEITPAYVDAGACASRRRDEIPLIAPVDALAGAFRREG